MFFEGKLEETRMAIDQMNESERIVVWGTGRHTDELMKYTKLLLYPNVMFASRDHSDDLYFGRAITETSELDLNGIDSIVISSYKFQDEIEKEIRNKKFSGKIIKFYNTGSESEFYLMPHSDSKKGFYVQGDYASWEEAKKHADGYDNQVILDKVYRATLEVMNGKAKYERDSVVFYDTAYTYHLLTLIGVICSLKDTINVVDVGGALGSLYWQNKDFLDVYEGKNILWEIVEHPNYVKCGREKIQHEKINFWDDLSDIQRADIVIFSGVLQCIKDYEVMVKKAIKLRPKYILIDRTMFSVRSRIAIQYADETICTNAYPIKIFEETEILQLMEGYHLKVQFPSCVDGIFYVDRQRVDVKCMIFELE